MANNKPAPKNWNDVQVAIATASMVTTLACWNMFAGPDRASALERAQEQATVDPATIVKACYECGANYYFMKPLDFNQMKRQMKKMSLIL